MIVPFLGQNYKHSSLNVSPQETVNLYPELPSDRNAKSNYILKRTPGTETFIDASASVTGKCRGEHFAANSILYTVLGDTLFEVSENGSYTSRGNVGLQSLPVEMADNGEYLIIVDGLNMWSLKFDTNSFNQVSLAGTDLENPTHVLWINNRMVSVSGLDNKYYWSDNGDPITWTGLNFNTANSSADNIISITKRQNELWLFGKQSYEVHAITRDSNLPFSYRGGSASEIGCGAIRSVSQIAENIFWFGSNRAGSGQIFMSANGYSANPISDESVEHSIAQMQNDPLVNASDAVAFTYSQEGHTFYVITFITGNVTHVFDVTTGQWHIRSTRSQYLNEQNKWEPMHAVYAYDKVICGSDANAMLFTLSLDKYDEYDGRPIVVKRVSPIYWNSTREAMFESFVLDIETGVGLRTGQGSDPLAMFRISRDSGHTWGNQITRELGKIGNYGYRVRINGLGASRALAIEFTCSEPVKLTLINANLEYEVCDL